MTYLKVFIKQRITPIYRKPLADALRDARIFEGKRIRVTWISDIQGLTEICRYCHQILRERPQVIVAETWSDKYCFLSGLLLSRLLGIRYVSWSLVKPPFERHSLKFLLGVKILKRCDHHICYSSYGSSILKKMGIPSERISVVVNVGLASFFQRNRRLGIHERFLRVERRKKYRIGYVGSTGNKKRFLDLVWAVNEANEVLNSDKFDLVCAIQSPVNFVIKKEAFPNLKYLKIFRNVASEHLPIFYGVIDVLCVPGQGGQVISEALSSHVPVFVGEGDGTQFDLVERGGGKVTKLNESNEVSNSTLLDLVLDIPKTLEENTLNIGDVPDHFVMRDQILKIIRQVYEDNYSLS